MRRPTRNAALLFAGELATRFLGFLVSALLARRLGMDGFGQVAFAMGIMSYGVIATKFGLLTVGIRDIAQDHSATPRLSSNLFSLRLALSLAVVLFSVLFALLVNKPLPVKLLLLLFAASVPIQSLLLEWVFNGLERMEFIAASHVVTNGVYFALVALFVRGPNEILLVPIAFGCGILASVVLLAVVYARRFGPPRLGFDFSLWRHLALSSWPVGVAAVLSQFYVNSGIIALALLRTDYESGLFAAAHRLVFFLLILDRVLQAVFLPLVSRSYRTDPSRLPRVTGDVLRVILVASLPLCTGLSLLARPALLLVFGPESVAAAPALALLCWFLPLSLLSTLAGYSLLAAGKEKRFCLNTALAVGAAVAVLIPGIIRWGVYAAALSLIVGEVLMLVLMARDALRVFRPRLDARFVVPVLANVVLGVVLVMLRNWNWPAAAAAGALAYLAILFAARGLTLADLGLVKQ